METSIKVIREILEKYKATILAELNEQCRLFKIIGTPHESPRWFIFAGVEKGYLKFVSSQTSRLWFIVELDKEDLDLEYIQTDIIRDWFRPIKYAFLAEYHPTIKID